MTVVPQSLRLALLFVATVFGGILATMVAPAVASSYMAAHAQSAPTPASSAQAVHVPATMPAGHPRAESAPPVTWTRAVATRDLVRGDTLQAGDFVLADTAITGRLPFGVDTTTPAAGWIIRRAIAAGEWLRIPSVAPRPAVTAGQPVQAIWTDGDVHLAVRGVALNTAPVGGAVSVRIGRTRRLDGVVIAPDSVRLR